MHVDFNSTANKKFRYLVRLITLVTALVVTLASAQITISARAVAQPRPADDQGYKVRMRTQNYFLTENDPRPESRTFPGFPDTPQTMFIHSLHLYEDMWGHSTQSRLIQRLPGETHQRPINNFTFAGKKLPPEETVCWRSHITYGPSRPLTACQAGNIDLSYTLFGTQSTLALRMLPRLFSTDEQIRKITTEPIMSDPDQMQAPPGHRSSAYWTPERRQAVFDWTVNFLAMQNSFTSRLNCNYLPYEVSNRDMMTIEEEVIKEAMRRGILMRKSTPSQKTKGLASVAWVDPTSKGVDAFSKVIDDVLQPGKRIYNKLSRGARNVLTNEIKAPQTNLSSVLNAAAAGIAINNIIEVHQDPASGPMDYADAYLSLGAPVISLASRGFGIAGLKADPVAAGTFANPKMFLAKGSVALGKVAGLFDVATSTIGIYQGAVEGDYVKVGIKAITLGIAIASIAATGLGAPVAAVLSFVIGVVDALWEAYKPSWVGQEVRLEKFRDVELQRIGRLRTEVSRSADQASAALYQKKRMEDACGIPQAVRQAPKVPALDGIITIQGFYWPAQLLVPYVQNYPAINLPPGNSLEAKEVHLRLEKVGGPAAQPRGKQGILVDTASTRDGKSPSRSFTWKMTSVKNYPPGTPHREFTLQIQVNPKLWPSMDNSETRDACYNLYVILGDKVVGASVISDPPLICANNTLADVKADVFTSAGVPPYGTPSDLAEKLRQEKETYGGSYFAYSYEIE